VVERTAAGVIYITVGLLPRAFDFSQGLAHAMRHARGQLTPPPARVLAPLERLLAPPADWAAPAAPRLPLAPLDMSTAARARRAARFRAGPPSYLFGSTAGTGARHRTPRQRNRTRARRDSSSAAPRGGRWAWRRARRWCPRT
jgi:hypothetical protein